ncbi:MAG: signal recognition particle protein [Blastochloris viridis]|uniref:signal-recognition-particle GTPase n=1 Tax=Blastochloris viridis TaxID=1079 RepID=A0A6N4R672_BLAVI|nr:MAG: signal recognition particle protein [Blastochloris viridis]
MLEFIQEKLGKALSSLTGKGLLTEADVDAALRELRVSLLEADVALPAIKHLMATVRERAVGEAVLKGANAGQQVVKIVYDALVELLGTETPLELKVAPPAVILMCGLQGGGKTTTSGKLAKWLKDNQKKTVMLASLDVYRPAAIEQLKILADKTGAISFDHDSRDVMVRAKAAMADAKKQSVDVLIVDTAGRLAIDETLMTELVTVRDFVKPAASLLVADGQTGQVAVDVAKAFHEKMDLTGLVLTRMDGDARGGAALSMRHITGVPILFLGMGEQVGALEAFRPEGLAGRILGQGDVVALVGKLQAAASSEDGAKLEEKMMSGKSLDMTDLKKQMLMMKKMGGMTGMLDLLPGMGALKNKIDPSKVDDKIILRQIAVIDSMTAQERKNPAILNAKRRIRIAKGCGLTVHDVNKVVKMHEQMNQMTKMMRSGQLQKMMSKMK